MDEIWKHIPYWVAILVILFVFAIHWTDKVVPVVKSDVSEVHHILQTGVNCHFSGCGMICTEIQ